MNSDRPFPYRIFGLIVAFCFWGDCETLQAAEQINILLSRAAHDPLIDFTPPSDASGDQAIASSSGLLIRQAQQRPGSGTPANTGLKFLVSASGDFEATLDFELKRLEEPQQGWGQGLLFSIALDDAEQSVLQLGVLSAPGKGIRLRAEKLGRFVKTPVMKYHEIEFTKGKFVIGRSGDEAIFKVDTEAGVQELLRVGSPKADVRFASVWCTRQATGNTPAEFLLKELELRADSFFSYQKPRQSGWPWWKSLVAFQIVAIAALVLYRAKSSEP